MSFINLFFVTFSSFFFACLVTLNNKHRPIWIICRDYFQAHSFAWLNRQMLKLAFSSWNLNFSNCLFTQSINEQKKQKKYDDYQRDSNMFGTVQASLARHFCAQSQTVLPTPNHIHGQRLLWEDHADTTDHGRGLQSANHGLESIRLSNQPSNRCLRIDTHLSEDHFQLECIGDERHNREIAQSLQADGAKIRSNIVVLSLFFLNGCVLFWNIALYDIDVLVIGTGDANSRISPDIPKWLIKNKITNFEILPTVIAWLKLN